MASRLQEVVEHEDTPIIRGMLDKVSHLVEIESALEEKQMQLHDLKPNEGAKKGRKRVGRGTGSGMGKSAGRGTKGQSARTSGGVRLYHQGELALLPQTAFPAW